MRGRQRRRPSCSSAGRASVSVRLRPETRGIVGLEDLARMKPRPRCSSTSRARELVAPGALVEALKNDRPGYAAVDVYEQEPIVNGDIPCKMPNVRAPHLGWARMGYFELYFHEYFERIVNSREASRCLCNPTSEARTAFVARSQSAISYLLKGRYCEACCNSDLFDLAHPTAGSIR